MQKATSSIAFYPVPKCILGCTKMHFTLYLNDHLFQPPGLFLPAAASPQRMGILGILTMKITAPGHQKVILFCDAAQSFSGICAVPWMVHFHAPNPPSGSILFYQGKGIKLLCMSYHRDPAAVPDGPAASRVVGYFPGTKQLPLEEIRLLINSPMAVLV